MAFIEDHLYHAVITSFLYISQTVVKQAQLKVHWYAL